MATVPQRVTSLKHVMCLDKLHTKWTPEETAVVTDYFAQWLDPAKRGLPRKYWLEFSDYVG